MTSGKPVRWRRFAALGAAAVGALLVVASLWLGPVLRSPEQAAADAAPPSASLVSVPAERRVLAESLVARGQVMPGASEKLLPPIGANGPDAVVTQVSVRTGARLREGEVIAAQAGQPLFTLVLPFPLYRDLTGGLTGPDVTAVQKSLRRLGYSVPSSGRFDGATQSGLRKFFTARGYQVPTGDAEALRAAEAALAEAQAAYDEAVRQATGVEAAKKRLQEAKAAAATTRLSSGPVLRRSAVVRFSKSGSTVTAVKVKVGMVLAADTVLVELDGGAPTVAISVQQDEHGLLRSGQRATVYDEVSGTKATAEIESIATTARTDPATGSVGFSVVLKFVDPPLDAPDRTVRVEIPSSTTDGPVLAVPVSAVYSRPDGSTFVTVDHDGTPVDVTVVAGPVAGGWVQITSAPADAVTAGTLVVVGRG